MADVLPRVYSQIYGGVIVRQTELKDLFLHELKGIFNAETQLVKALWEETTRQSVGNGTMRPGPL